MAINAFFGPVSRSVSGSRTINNVNGGESLTIRAELSGVINWWEFEGSPNTWAECTATFYYE